VRKTRQRTGAGLSGTTTTPVTLTVVEAGAGTVVLDWHAGETRFSDPAQAANPIVKAVESAAKDLHLRFEIDARDYSWVRIVNQAELRAALTRVSNAIMAQLSSQIPDEATRKKVLDSVRRVAGPDVMMQSVGNEARLTFGVPRSEWKTGSVTVAETALPSPLGGGDLTGKVETRVVAVDEAKQEATIATSHTFDKAALGAMMKKVGAAAGLLPGVAPENMSVTDSADYSFDLQQPVPRRVLHTRRIGAGAAAARTDTTEITRR
jgi:hypothetical protein